MDSLLSKEIISKLSLANEEIFEMIGTEVSAGQDAFPPSGQELIRIGKRWWESNKEKLAVSVCDSKALQRVAEAGDDLALVVAIVDLISGIVTGVSPATVAVLIVKLGLEKVCENIWNKS